MKIVNCNYCKKETEQKKGEYKLCQHHFQQDLIHMQH